ncbi:MAG TPA: tryptophan synthase subunit alpha [Actinomycetota bacterium]
MGRLEDALRRRRAAGGRAFVPYVTGGYPGVDAAFLRRLADTGADAIEVGIPFSDPVMDGGVIQRASAEALRAGATPSAVLASIAEAALDVPVAVMTYANPVQRRGASAFLEAAAAAGVAGLIVPDVPVDESEDLEKAANHHGIDLVLLAAPGTTVDRLREIARRSHGFVYCVATYGVTGTRDRLAETARVVVDALRPATDLPLLLGVGIGTPDQAEEASGFADGVVVGSALMAELVAGDAGAALALAAAFRTAIPLEGTASRAPSEHV